MGDSADRVEQTPRTIGPYQVLGLIGQGATGAVYKALDPSSARPVVVKTFRLDVPTESAGYRSFIERFHNRASLARTLVHPNIVNVLDAGEDSGVPYLTLEYVEGETLAAVAGRGRIAPEKVFDWMRQAASAVDYAHAQGSVHGGLEPGKLLVDRTGHLRVTGFGFTRPVADETDGEVVIGTLAYMSPEQVRGSTLDARTDVFSLGVCAFELLSGELPFSRESFAASAYALMHSDPVEPANLEAAGFLRSGWRDVFGRVLAKAPGDRYPTASDFARDIEWLEEPPRALSGDDTAEIRLGAPAFYEEEAPERPLPLHDNVQFAVYRPRRVEPMRWYTLLAFAHLDELPEDAPEDALSPAEQVRQEAERLLGDDAADYGTSHQDSSLAVPHEAEITFVVDLPECEVNPTRRTFQWLEPVHHETFRFRAGASLLGRVARGRVTVFHGRLVLAELAISIRVGADTASHAAVEAVERSVARPFRKIFPSYSHKDGAVVDEFERYARTLGDVYLRDVHQLRSGERWDERLLGLIREADVFQLFWSWNALGSPFVEREWQYALSLQRPNFVRPTYWEQPLPSSVARGLPPETLRRLHFQLLPGSMSPPGAHLPAPSATVRPPAARSAPSTSQTGAFAAVIVPRSPTPADRAASTSLPAPAVGRSSSLALVVAAVFVVGLLVLAALALVRFALR